MRERCDNPNSRQYRWYGARGITYDPRWNDYKTFLADMGERPLGTTLDRKNNDQPYCKDNCQWSTDEIQQANRRRGNRHTVKAASGASI